jgi:hypothetical protein
MGMRVFLAVAVILLSSSTFAEHAFTLDPRHGACGQAGTGDTTVRRARASRDCASTTTCCASSHDAVES